MEPISFFITPHCIAQKQYEALRLYFVENVKAKEVAQKFGYSYRGFTTIISDFRNKLKKTTLKIYSSNHPQKEEL